jgi:hypothetical protein
MFHAHDLPRLHSRRAGQREEQGEGEGGARERQVRRQAEEREAMSSERGPVGGTGELTALVEKEIGDVFKKYDGHPRCEIVRKYVRQVLERALAAKAPQGVPAELRSLLAGARANHSDWVGYLVHKSDPTQQVMEFDAHCPKCVIDKALTLLVGPVSDDTIHHGPFPPAKTTTLLQELGNVPIRFGLEAQGHIPLVERMLANRKSWDEIGAAINWHGPTAQKFYKMYLDREAAAPKPAPPSDEQVRKGFYDREYREQEMLNVATPAPAAEPLHSLLPGTPVGEALCRLEHEVAVHILSESPAQEFMDDIKLVCRTLREALAAAPPAPQPIETLVHQLTKVTMELEDTLASLGKADSMITKLKDLIAERDRHSSAELVREDAFAEAARAIERVAKAWAESIAQGAYQGEMLRAADIRRDEGVDIAKLIRTLRALPPSTGEKS